MHPQQALQRGFVSTRLQALRRWETRRVEAEQEITKIKQELARLTAYPTLEPRSDTLLAIAS